MLTALLMKWLFPLIILAERVFSASRLLLAANILSEGGRTPLYAITGTQYPLLNTITPNGMRQMYSLGVYTRGRFETEGLLGPRLQDSEYLVFASTANSVYKSAQSLLLGLSHNEGPSLTCLTNPLVINSPSAVVQIPGSQALVDSFNPMQVYQPANYLSTPDFFQEMGECYYASVMTKAAYIDLWKTNPVQALVGKLNAALGQAGLSCQQLFKTACLDMNGNSNFDLNTTFFVNDYNQANYYYTGTYNWVAMDGATIDLLQRSALFYAIASQFGSKELPSIEANFVLQEVLKRFEANINTPSTNPLKYIAFADNSTSLLALLLAFNQTSSDCVLKVINGEQATQPCVDRLSFADSLSFELTDQADGQTPQYMVRGNFNSRLFPLCPTPTADLLCSFDDFKQTVSKILLPTSKYESFCIRKYAPHEPPFKNSRYYLWYGIALTSSMILGVFIIYTFYVKNKNFELSSNMYSKLSIMNREMAITQELEAIGLGDELPQIAELEAEQEEESLNGRPAEGDQYTSFDSLKPAFVRNELAQKAEKTSQEISL
jgi:hypothetical protein